MGEGGPVPGWLGPIGGLVGRLGERAYLMELGRRNRRFDRGAGVVTIDRPVISVGNLSVGGTGKTPAVAAIVRWLVEAGHRPAIAMRGYRAGGGESDEAREYAADLAGVPVVAQADRLGGLFRLFATEEGRAVDVVVLDDGFQHRKIARRLDVVLIDSTRDPFADRCLPAGWLREPVGNLRRAGAVVLTRADAVGDAEVARIADGVEAETGARPVALASHRWDGLTVADGGAERAEGVGWLRGKRVLAVCAIGNPGAFVAACEGAVGGSLAGAVVLRDHDPYSEATARRVVREAEGCDAVVTTGKDWAKLGRVETGAWPCAVARPVLRMDFGDGEAGLRGMVLRAAGTG